MERARRSPQNRASRRATCRMSVLCHELTGGLRRPWANKPLNTFPEALEAFPTAISLGLP